MILIVFFFVSRYTKKFRFSLSDSQLVFIIALAFTLKDGWLSFRCLFFGFRLFQGGYIGMPFVKLKFSRSENGL